jgi:hypothetical protein
MEKGLKPNDTENQEKEKCNRKKKEQREKMKRKFTNAFNFP